MMNEKKTIRFASRMDQLPPYLFGMINSMKNEERLRQAVRQIKRALQEIDHEE